jgi:chromosomal replication initiation ATPase DnaA
LSIFAGPAYAEADFRDAPSNQAARAWLRRTAEWPGGRLAVWGEAGCGKTHLLHIWSARTGASLLSGAGLSGPPEIPPRGIALDDADAAGDQRALLYLLNASAEARVPVVLAARPPPARWGVDLPDLASRLRAMVAVEIRPPDDALLNALLARLLADRQLRVADEVRRWLVEHLPRSAASLRTAVQRLDEASLDQHRNITARFAARTLADLLVPEPEDSPSPEAEGIL